MAEVIWTERALNDLEDIGNYIAKDSVRYARLTISNLIDTEFNIAMNPSMGRIVPEINNQNIREIIKGNYRVIYEIRQEKIFILTVYHSARNLTESKVTE